MFSRSWKKSLIFGTSQGDRIAKEKIASSRWISNSEFVLEVKHENLVGQRSKFFQEIFDFLELRNSGYSAAFARRLVIHPQDTGDLKVLSLVESWEG